MVGAGCRPPVEGPKESCAQPCPPITQTEGTGEERSHDPVTQHKPAVQCILGVYSARRVTCSASACHMRLL